MDEENDATKQRGSSPRIVFTSNEPWDGKGEHPADTFMRIMSRESSVVRFHVGPTLDPATIDPVDGPDDDDEDDDDEDEDEDED